MPFFLVVLLVFLVLATLSILIVFFHSRKLLREQKNYERGLKMVPLLIHLPPSSEDIQSNGRDNRDVTEENISKAQILYSIIASTVTKGFKSKFYGQRHFAFEIIGTNGVVKFYAAVPVALVDIVKQAVISAYPTAQLEEVEEYNIFSPVGRLAGTIGGELSLKEHFGYPIATYQEIKRDAMQSLLNALSTLDKEDGAGIQILLRPADPSWRKGAQSVASGKRKGEKDKKGAANVMWWTKQLVGAAVKPPEDKSGKGEDSSSKKADLSSLDQSILDAIDDKTRYPGYEVLIRVVASSNISQRSQTILRNIVAAFSLYDAPGKNGFKYTVAKDMESFVTAFILRFFPPESNRNVLNAVELATLFHFPDQKNIPTSQLERQASKQVDAPRNIPEEGLLLGYNLFRGAKKPIRLTLGDRQRHMYVVGQTGTGKSTFLENLAIQDMLNGDGFAFVDPHGDTAEKLLSMVPKERTEDVIYFCPAEMDFPMGLNLFEFTSDVQKDFLIQEAINILYKLYDPNRQGMIGARFEHIFRNCALLLMADPQGGTFIDIPKLLIDPDFMKAKLKYVTDQNVLDFWTKEWPNSQRSNESGEVTSWVVSKFGAFLSNQMMRNIIGQTKSSFDLREIMDNKKILLVNLSKGKTGDLNSKLMGMIFVMKFQAAAMSRANVPENERPDFCLYVDEFQNFSTDSFATIMSEARKYHLNLIVANQFTTQLSEEIRDAVFGNMGTIVSYRIGQNDVESMSRYFQPLFEGDDLLRIPSFNAVVRTLIGGVPTQPFSMAGLPPLGTPNQNLGQALRQLSAAKYGRPKAQVEKEIFARLATKAAPTRTAANQAFGQPGQAKPAFGQQPKAPTPPGAGSFLDEWLAKRKSSPQTNPSARPAQAPQASVTPASTPLQPYTPPTASTASTAPLQPSQNNDLAQPIPTPAPQPTPLVPSAPGMSNDVQQTIKQPEPLQTTPNVSSANDNTSGIVNLSQQPSASEDEELIVIDRE
jgi:hypothetical protein